MVGVLASMAVNLGLDKLSSFLRASLTSPPTASSSSSLAMQDDLEDLRSLERTMRRIRAALQDAEEHWNIRDESAKLRLEELKEVAYDAEDVVDEYEYEVNRCKLEALERSAGVQSSNNKRKRHEKGNGTNAIDTGIVAIQNELVVQARKIIKRYDEINKDHVNLALTENDGERRFAPDISSLREVGSDVCERSILGREHDKDNIVKKLLPIEDEGIGNPISVQAIVGMGGLGKTTLAQLVYNDPRVRQSFDMHAWACVSDQFDVRNITRKIIESLPRDKKCEVTELANLQEKLLGKIKDKKVLLVLDDVDKKCEVTELANLQEKLLGKIKDKKVLLVLDDVWNERGDCWEKLCAPLSKTKVCKIIVTTRSDLVAKLVQTMPCYRIKFLNFDESWSLFKQVAFPVHQENDTPANLVEIGRSIAKKCDGLPLAIKTLASMLRYETDEMRWRHVLESQLWNLERSWRILGNRHTSVDFSIVSDSLRAIIVLPGEHVNIEHLKALVLGCKKLRALCLGRSNISNALPDYIGSLKLLRHLKSGDEGYEPRPAPSGLGHLINLHSLPPIHISACGCNCNIRELRKLNKIRELRIKVWGSADANEAQLLSKKHLQSLELNFSDKQRCCYYCEQSVQTKPVTVTHEQLLDSLRPHDGLRELTIEDYMSAPQKYPNWLGNASFYNLTKIELRRSHSEHVPTLGELPSLKFLKIEHMSSVRQIGREFCSHAPGMKGFRSLTCLEFDSLPKWSEWSGVDDGDFPCLRTLSISFANQLRSLPSDPFPSLVALKLCFCNSLGTVPAWPTLRELFIEHCLSLNELPTLPSLLKLELTVCPNLSAVSSLPSLTTLGLIDNWWNDERLYRLLNYHPSLECVTIICHTDATTCIPLDPQGLPSLRKLRLSCPNLQYCDGLAGLTSLKELKVWGCPKFPVHSLRPRQLQNPDIRDKRARYFANFDEKNFDEEFDEENFDEENYDEKDLLGLLAALGQVQ